MKNSKTADEITPGMKLVAPRTKAVTKTPRIIRQKVARALPTERLTFASQLELLRAYVIASEQKGEKPVVLREVSKLTSWNYGTTAFNNPFFNDAGLVTNAGNGYLPAPEAVSFTKAWNFDHEKAGRRLAPVLRRSWFGQLLLPRLAMKPLSEADAMTELAVEAEAGKQQTRQLRTLIDYLECAGLVMRDGAMLRLGVTATMGGGVAVAQEESEPVADVKELFASPVISAREPISQQGIRFQIEVNVDMQELSRWKAEAVAAFFKGVADVIAAKAKIEKDG